MLGKVIAIDFDKYILSDTATFPQLSSPRPGIINMMGEWSHDSKISITTTRNGEYLEAMIRYLSYYDIPYDYINYQGKDIIKYEEDKDEHFLR